MAETQDPKETTAAAASATTTTSETTANIEDEQKIMCFVSKQMIPISQTVEVEYMPHKKVRVMPKYIRLRQQ